MERKIKWQSRHIDNLNYDGGHSEEDDFASEIDEEMEMQQQLPKIMATPLGFFQKDDTLNPFSTFEIWEGNTNFDIDIEVVNKIEQVHGVEALHIISPYRFLVSVGEMFNWRDVRVGIERSLCGHLQPYEIGGEELTEEAKERLDEACTNLSNHRYWAVYMFPNGKIHSIFSDDWNDNFADALALMSESTNITGGIMRTYE